MIGNEDKRKGEESPEDERASKQLKLTSQPSELASSDLKLELDAKVEVGSEIDAKPEVVDEKPDQAESEQQELERLRLTKGGRLEVMWDLVDDATNVSTTHWWGCKLGDAEATLNSEGRRVWSLLYDAKGEFEECTVQVTFDSEHELWDTEQKTFLRFRRQGEVVEEDEEDENGAGQEEGVVVTMPEILADQEALDREQGGDENETVEGLGLQALSQLPQQQQRSLAHGYLQMADHFREAFAKLQENNGPDYVITVKDIEGIKASLLNRS